MYCKILEDINVEYAFIIYFKVKKQLLAKKKGESKIGCLLYGWFDLIWMVYRNVPHPVFYNQNSIQNCAMKNRTQTNTG